MNALSIFPNEDQPNLLMSGSFDTNVKIWDLRKKEAVTILKGHTMQINSVAGSPDGKMVVSGSSDGLVKVLKSLKKK